MAVEEPAFKEIEKNGDISIRRVAAYWVAEMVLEGNEQDVGNAAFRPLLRYISGDNRSAQKIQMTAPVNQLPANEKIAMTAPVNQASREDGRYAVSFVLPAEFNNRTPPEPLDARIQLRQVPERTVAAIRYSGTWSAERMHAKRAELLSALENSKQWKAIGVPVWSRFDPPFMPWFLRRNEVQVEVAQRKLPP